MLTTLMVIITIKSFSAQTLRLRTRIILRENALNSQPSRPLTVNELNSLTAMPIKMRLRVRKVVKKVVYNELTNQIDEPVYEPKTKGNMRLRLKMLF